MEGNTVRVRLATLFAACFVCGASQAQTPPNGPVADILNRLASLEREVAELRNAAGKGSVLVDANGRTVGRVLADSLDQAVVAVELEEKEWAFAFSEMGGSWGADFDYAYPTVDCSGPGYVLAVYFNDRVPSDMFFTTMWGPDLLPIDKNDGQYKLPRVGASQQQIYRLSQGAPDNCRSYAGLAGSRAVYALDDLRVVDPFAGLVPPFKVVPAN